MTSGFADKVCVVTGSTQGLGAATVRLMAERGARGIVVHGRNVDRGEAVAAELTSTGTDARFVAADLGDADACLGLVAAADEAFGQVDVVVNAAALTVRGTVLDTSPELWDAMMAVNARAPFLLTQAAAKVMRREGGGGSIVNVGSVAAYGGQEFLAPYVASKAALLAFTRNAAFALAPDRIRVNSLNPGWMDSDGEDVIQRRFHSNGADWLADAEAGQPFGRLIKPDEAARAICFLASDESGLMTGSLVDFDQTIQGAGTMPNPGTTPLPDDLTTRMESGQQ